MRPTRRQYLLGSVTLVSAAGIGTTVLAQEEQSPLAFVEIAPEEEYVIIENVSDEQLDLTGYSINFEVGQQVNQTRDIPDDTILDPGTTLKIASGYKQVSDADIEYDFDNGAMNDDGSDVIGILNPDGELVIRSDNDDDRVSEDTDQTPEPTDEPRETPTEEPTDEPTDEPPEDPADDPTAEPTDEPTDEPTKEDPDDC